MKHAIFLFLYCILITTAKAQKKDKSALFILNGQIEGRDTGFIILTYIDQSRNLIIDTTYLKNGKFSFKGNISEPASAYLDGYLKKTDHRNLNHLNIFLEHGIQDISLVEDNYAEAKMSGSFTESEWMQLSKEQSEIDSKYSLATINYNKANEAYRKYKKESEKRNLSPSEDSLFYIAKNETALYSSKLDQKTEESRQVTISFIRTHPDSYISAFGLASIAQWVPPDTLQKLFNGLTSRIQNSIYCEPVKHQISRMYLLKKGHTAPDFTANAIDSIPVRLSQMRGKYVLLDFWASWCIPCREAIPHLKQVYEQYHKKGFDLISISLDKDTVAWRKAVAAEQIYDWYNVLVNKYIADKYENVNLPIPSQILIDPEGIIVWKNQDKEYLDDILKRLLQ